VDDRWVVRAAHDPFADEAEEMGRVFSAELMERCLE